MILSKVTIARNGITLTSGNTGPCIYATTVPPEGEPETSVILALLKRPGGLTDREWEVIVDSIVLPTLPANLLEDYK